MKRIFIAYNRALGTHYLFEIIRDNTATDYSQYEKDIVNELSSWTKLSQLIDLLEKTGPLVTNNIVSQEERSITLQRFIDGLKMVKHDRLLSAMQTCDLNILHDFQLYIIEGESGKLASNANAKQVIQERDLFKPENIETIIKLSKQYPKGRVVIEPLTDLLFVRNYLSIILKMLGHYQNKSKTPITDSGFIRADNPYYQIKLINDLKLPYISGTWYQKGSNLRMPLLQTLFSMPTTKSIVFFENMDYTINLAIQANNSERAIVEEFIRGLYISLLNLRTASGNHLAWEYKVPGPNGIGKNGMLTYKSLFGYVFATALNQVDKHIGLCKRCNRGILVSNSKKPRLFCSDSCRAAFYKFNNEKEQQ